MKSIRVCIILCSLVSVLGLSRTSGAQHRPAEQVIPKAQVFDEPRVSFLSNLERVDKGAAIERVNTYVVSKDAKNVNKKNNSLNGQSYAEWESSTMTTAFSNHSYTPVQVPEGYYNKLKSKADSITLSLFSRKLRQARRSRRIRICQVCDSSVDTGRIIVRNEAVRGALKSKGLVAFVDMICASLKDGFSAELDFLECDVLHKHIASYYDPKYVHTLHSNSGRYNEDGTTFARIGITRKVNIALASALQNCKSLLGLDFCDAVMKDL